MTQKNIWKHVQVDSDRLKSNRYLNPSSPSPETEVTPPPAPKSISTGADYELLPVQTTYAIAVHVLRGACHVNLSTQPLFTREDGSRIYRPLTFKETIQAKIEDYNTTHDKDGNERTLDDRLRFFNKYIDSCTGMSYKKESTEFQIILECSPLIEIARDFNEAFLPDSYASVKNGIKLNSSGRGKKYNQSLTKQEIENHEGWRTAVDDVALLRNHRDIVFSALAARNDGNMPDKAMGFYVRSNTDEDELRALFVSYLYYSSYADGSGILYNIGSFLRAAQSNTP